ncbi:MAG TPA: hypothetical protein VGF59_07105 [Bryobacteraceae bacterium]|jgi:hypothetical protein
MTATAAKDPRGAIGRSPDRLSLDERQALTGKYIALEIYNPKDLPLRRIEAIGDSIDECVRMLKSRGLDPTRFEYSRLPPPY